MEDPEFDEHDDHEHDEFDEHEHLEMMTLEEALRKAEDQVATTKGRPDLDNALELALMEAVAPAVKETWRGIDDRKDDMLNPSRKLAALTMPDCDHDCDWVPQAVGHALVTACQHGLLLVVRRLREIQRDRESGSLMVGLFNAFGLLKAAEGGHEAVVSELLTPMLSASAALMGFMVATKWKETGYPFVTPPSNPPNTIWNTKLANSKSSLPPAVPIFQAGWELKGSNPGMTENLHEIVRASYRTYLLWRVVVILATKCHVDVFRILLLKRSIDNLFLKEVLARLVQKSADGGQHAQAKRLVADRAKMDTAMYQCVEEYSTKNYNDAMLYTLWKFCVGQETGKDVGKPKCVAEAHDGMWEIKLEVPLLMMQVEHAHKNEEAKDRYKQCTMLYPQTAQLGIQIQTAVHAQPDFVQVEVKIKHVRLKAENSRWDDSAMGHFPSGVTISVRPLSELGSSVTLTNSSHNQAFTVGRGENFSTGASLVGSMGGLGGRISGSMGINNSVLMKSTPWRFEQVPVPDSDDRGGSFKWTLQSMKGIPFDRTNPTRMAAEASIFKFGRRVPSNPLSQLPFTSEGGVQFTDKEFSDTMLWRFPKTLENQILRWRIEGEIYTTYTTTRYFETRTASFSGEVEDLMKPDDDEKDKDKGKDKDKEKDKDKDKDKKKDKEKDKDKDKDKKKDKEKDKDKDKDKDGEKDTDGKKVKDKEKKDKEKDKEEDDESLTPTLEKFSTAQRKQFLQWLEFQKAMEEMQAIGTPKPVLAKTVDPVVEGGEGAGKLEEAEEEEEEGERVVQEEAMVGSQVVEATEIDERAPASLSRLTASKGKTWFSRK